MSITGLLLVDKPAGMTSHDVVGRIRRVAKTRKVGHTGTLDPDATGLLPITIGACTKLAQYLLLDNKTYAFEMELGKVTDTDDASGETIAEHDPSGVSAEDVEGLLEQFRGEIMQRPPRYSAIRVDGKRAYELARAGVEFEIPARPVTVHSLEITGVELPRLQLLMRSSSGTYVRSVVRDLGALLGVGAHTTMIRRLGVGTFGIEDAVKLDALVEGEVDVHDVLLSPAKMMEGLRSVTIDSDGERALGFGQSLPLPGGFQAPEDEPIALLDSAGSLAAVAFCRELDGVLMLRPKRVLLERDS